MEETQTEPQETQQPQGNQTVDNMKHYAQLSHGAYGGGKDMSELGYEIDPEHSNRNRTLYHNKNTGKAVLAFRGTELKTKNKLGDLSADALLALGLHDLSSRFRNAKKATAKAIEKYGDNLTLTGHSLGGSQALYANSKFGNLETHAYNPGVSPTMVKKSLMDNLSAQLFKRKPKKTATIYTTGKDIISGLSPLFRKAKTVFVKGRGKNAHSLDNFL
jgi:hypothetical protein